MTLALATILLALLSRPPLTLTLAAALLALAALALLAALFALLAALLTLLAGTIHFISHRNLRFLLWGAPDKKPLRWELVPEQKPLNMGLCEILLRLPGAKSAPIR